VTANHLFAAGNWGSFSLHGGISTTVNEGSTNKLATRIGIGVEF